LEDTSALAMYDPDVMYGFFDAGLEVIVQKIIDFFWIKGVKVDYSVYGNFNTFGIIRLLHKNLIEFYWHILPLEI
jgi:hypothetical protein